MERFPKIAWVGGVSGTPIGRNAEPYSSLTFFSRNILEIKKMIKKNIRLVILILHSTPLPNLFSESAPSI